MHPLRLLSILPFAAGLLLAGRAGYAQESAPWDEVGAFEIQNFSPRDYGAAPQIWDMVQDGRGVLYAATDGGVLEYDGVTWRLIPTPEGQLVRTLALDASGRVFAGAQDELGFVASDGTGRPRFRSLRALLPAELQRFGDIRSTVATPEGVYFSSALGLFRWSDAEGMRVWPLRGSGRRMGYVGGRLLVHERERGLLVLQGDSLLPVPGGEALIGMQGAAILPRASGSALILTRTDGFFSYDGARVVPYPTHADALLRAAQVMDGTLLPDGTLALATLRRGLILLDARGRLLRAIDRAAGMRDHDARAVLRDRAGQIWVGLNNGLARIDLASPLTTFAEADGLSGFVLDVARQDGRIFAATSQGIRFLDVPAEPGRTPTFRAVPGLPEFCHKLLATEHGLLAGCDHGVFVISPDAARAVYRIGESVYTIGRSARAPDRVYVGMSDGLSVLEWRDGRWADAGRLPNFRAEVRHVADGAGDAVWIGTARAGLYRAAIPADVSKGHAARVGTWHDEPVRVFSVAGRLLFSSRQTLFRAEETPVGPRLVPDTTLSRALPPGSAGVSHLAEADDGSLWLRAGSARGVARASASGLVWDAAPLRRLPQMSIYAFYPEPDGVVWIGMPEGLVRYDPRTGATAPEPAPAVLVRGVTLLGSDSLLYGGTGPPPSRLVLGHRHGALRFGYSAPGVANVVYQTRLDGFEDEWSAWTSESRRDYTNLREGRYTFRVRSRAPDGEIGPEAAFAFSVLPPWYRTWWAYAFYLILLASLGWMLLRLYNARLHARNLHLEALVHARTAQVEAQKSQLEGQNVQIQAQAEQLRQLDAAKSRFFANISHEFRTPLTLTLGPIEDLLEGHHGALSDEARTNLDLVRRNAYRLLRLVNRMLDLARLESGNLELHARPHDLVAFLRDTTAAFAPLAERRGIALDFSADDERLQVTFDAERLEEIVVNLLANSFKATPTEGRIGVRLASVDGWAEIRVDDTGTGIEPESLSVIFDRFRQGRAAQPDTVGSGIGLNLVQELVHLHGGEITVESVVGAGSVFTVRLPIADFEWRIADFQDVGTRESKRERLSAGVERQRTEASGGSVEGDGAPLPQPFLKPDEAPSPLARSEIRNPISELDLPTVLVVDDNAEIRAYVRQHLDPFYRVEEAADGDEGYALARTLLPDLILSDVMMPRRDGYDLCRALKSDPDLDHVPVVLLTAKASSGSRIEGLDAEADDYLTKPFNARELLARVRNLIASRQKLRDRFRQEVVVRPSGVTASPADSVFLEQLREVIEAHLADADFSVEDLAAAVALSPSQLQRRVKALTEMTPVQLVRHMRLERAADLLSQRVGSVSEVAYAVGFNSHAYFAQSFRAHFGTTPSAYMADGGRT